MSSHQNSQQDQELLDIVQEQQEKFVKFEGESPGEELTLSRYQSVFIDKSSQIKDMEQQEKDFISTIQRKEYKSGFAYILENKPQIQQMINQLFSISFSLCELSQDEEILSKYQSTVLKQNFKWISDHVIEILKLIGNAVDKFNKRQSSTSEQCQVTIKSTCFSTDDLKLFRILRFVILDNNLEDNNCHPSPTQAQTKQEGSPEKSSIQLSSYKNGLDNLHKVKKLMQLVIEKLFSVLNNYNYPNALISKNDIKRLKKYIVILQFHFNEMFLVFSPNSFQQIQENIQEYDILQPQKGQLSPTFHSDNSIKFQKIKNNQQNPHVYNSMLHKIEVIENADLLNFKISYQNYHFPDVQPAKQQVYVAEVTRALKKVTPFKIVNYFSGQNKTPLKIELPDYFHLNSQRKILHYFKEMSNILVVYDIECVVDFINDKQEMAIKIPLNCNFVFARDNRSIITPEGQIYLIAGKHIEDGGLDNSLYQFDPQNNSLREKRKLIEKRRLFGVCFQGNFIFVVGGQTEKLEYSGSCEKYDLETKQWSRIAELNEPVHRPCICTFRNRYIFKFCGINHFGYIDKTIERYCPISDQWQVVSYQQKDLENDIEVLNMSLCCQINENEILIFGGYNQNDFKSDEAFLFEDLGEDETLYTNKLRGCVTSLKQSTRTIYSYAGVFQEGPVYIHGCAMYTLRKSYL